MFKHISMQSNWLNSWCLDARPWTGVWSLSTGCSNPAWQSVLVSLFCEWFRFLSKWWNGLNENLVLSNDLRTWATNQKFRFLQQNPLRSVIFFFMLIMLGMDSAMGGLECVITGIMDEYQGFFQKRRISRSHHICALRIQEYTNLTWIFREVFTGFIVFSSYAVAITCVTPVKEQKK